MKKYIRTFDLGYMAYHGDKPVHRVKGHVEISLAPKSNWRNKGGEEYKYWLRFYHTIFSKNGKKILHHNETGFTDMTDRKIVESIENHDLADFLWYNIVIPCSITNYGRTISERKKQYIIDCLHKYFGNDQIK